MSKYKDAYLAYMDREGIKYTDVNERNVRVTYNGDNCRSITVSVTFDDKDGHGAHFVCYDIGSFKGDKYANALLLSNELCCKYRWVKFYLDSDKDVVVDCDASFDLASCGYVCRRMVSHVVSIVDEAYLEYMKIKFA